MTKPYFEHIDHLTSNHKAYSDNYISYQANGSTLARSLFTKHRIVLGEGYSYRANPKDKYGILPYEKTTEEEIKDFLVTQFLEYRLLEPRRLATMNGIYHNYHLDFVARFINDDLVVEIDFRKWSTLMERSACCKLSTIYLVDSGLTFWYNSSIVGTIAKQPQAYADPETYRLRGTVLDSETGKTKVYSHFGYIIDSLGYERKVV